MALALRPAGEIEPEALKFNQRLLEKLKFCKEVLVSIRKASAAGIAPDENETAPVVARTINAKASKASLR